MLSQSTSHRFCQPPSPVFFLQAFRRQLASLPGEDNAVWAPQFQSVRLLDDAGRNLTVKNKSELKQVRAVELTEAALLSVCDGNKPVDRSDGVMSKGPVPAAKPGRFNVAGLSYPKLRSGELVEFEVTIAADQIVMISR